MDANQDWAKVTAIGQRILDESLGAILPQISLPKPPYPDAQGLIVFNALNWSRSELISLPLPQPPSGGPPQAWQIYSLEGRLMPSHLRAQHPTAPPNEISFLAQDIPAIGYRGYWLCPSSAANSSNTPTTSNTPTPNDPPSPNVILSNPWLQVTLDRSTGNITSLMDRTTQREILAGPGNQLQAFRDQGQYWDAWNIAPDYADHPLHPPPSLICNG
jgi:alpha-mannosidase